MSRKPSKKLKEAVETLVDWLQNTDRKHVDGLLKFVASFPFADEMEDMGYEPSVPLMGWLEFQNIENVMHAIEDREDVEYLVRQLVGDESED